MKFTWVRFVLLTAALFVAYRVTGQEPTFTEIPLEITLDGSFVSQAILTVPTTGQAPYPTVILFHGSGPYDMDASYGSDAEGAPLSRNFKVLAEGLSARGVAVLRFNKRGVLGSGEYDFAQVQAATLDQLILDAASVIDTALAHPDVDGTALYLYGWSEGAWVVSNVAQDYPDLAGLILLGAPDDSLATILPYQHLELGLPYLSDVTDVDQDGRLSLDEIATIPNSAVGLMATFYLYDRNSTPDSPVLNTFTNRNGDEFIDIDTELRPVVDMFIKNYAAYLPKLEASYVTGELLNQVGIPTLILQGEQDGWVPVRSAEAITEAAPQVVTLMIYEGLGHALSQTGQPAEDVFGVMSDAPIADITEWMMAR